MMAFTLRLSPSGISRTCCLTCLLLLPILLASFASTSNVVKFTQNTKAADDEINDILEDEFLLIVDPESPQSAYKRPASKAKNASSKSASSSSIASSSASSVSHTRTEQRPRTTPVPSDLLAVHTTHASAVFDAGFNQEEFADDFLILSQDRELVERVEERRRGEEKELARRVKRRVLQLQNIGSGASSDNLEDNHFIPTLMTMMDELISVHMNQPSSCPS